MSIRILTPGLLTSVQDCGRFGQQRIGMSPSGAMDLNALRLANILVDNPIDEAALEMTMLGASIQFDLNCVFALTGADMGASLDGAAIPVGRAIAAKAGSVLRMGGAKKGCRGYLAINGGFDLPAINGSKSTLLRSHIGGFQGRALKAGDVLPLAAPKADILNLSRRVLPAVPQIPSPALVRVILGPQDDYFTKEGLKTFLNSTYVLDPKSDRMGCRFNGPKVELSGSGNIISDGIPLGAVQIPGSGLPIVMMSEHQGSGGYPKIANVISVDLPLLAQCKPGDSITFKSVSVEEAQTLYLEQLEEYRYLSRVFQSQIRGNFYNISTNGHDYKVRIIPC